MSVYIEEHVVTHEHIDHDDEDIVHISYYDNEDLTYCGAPSNECKCPPNSEIIIVTRQNPITKCPGCGTKICDYCLLLID